MVLCDVMTHFLWDLMLVLGFCMCVFPPCRVVGCTYALYLRASNITDPDRTKLDALFQKCVHQQKVCTTKDSMKMGIVD